MAGVCRLKFKGAPGYGTYIRYGEVLVQPTTAVKYNNQNFLY
jgi:hypothetical protein